jgi:hypothetical protein
MSDMTEQEYAGIVLSIAAVCHENNRAYCQAIGDDSILPWHDAPEWQKRSAYDGVIYRLTNPTATPEDMHKNWMKEKIKDGWIHGPVKDPETKRHPCICAYKDLPQEQKSKDYLFGAIVDRMKMILLPEGE